MSAATVEMQRAGVLPLDALRRGQRARIDAVRGPAEWVKRLREIGLRDDAEIRMLRQGSTCMIRLGYQTLCIRCNESTCVLVRPVGALEAPAQAVAGGVAGAAVS